MTCASSRSQSPDCASFMAHAIHTYLLNQAHGQPMGRGRLLRFRLARLVCIKPTRDQHTSVSTDVLPKCKHPIDAASCAQWIMPSIQNTGHDTTPPNALAPRAIRREEYPSSFRLCPRLAPPQASSVSAPNNPETLGPLYVRKELAGASESERRSGPAQNRAIVVHFGSNDLRMRLA